MPGRQRRELETLAFLVSMRNNWSRRDGDQRWAPFYGVSHDESDVTLKKRTAGPCASLFLKCEGAFPAKTSLVTQSSKVSNLAVSSLERRRHKNGEHTHEPRDTGGEARGLLPVAVSVASLLSPARALLCNRCKCTGNLGKIKRYR